MSGVFRVLRFILLVVAMTLATFALGWPGVPFVAIGFSIADRGVRVAWETARAAAVAWTALLVVHVLPTAFAGGPGPSIVRTVAGALGMPALVPPIVTIAFATLLAWSAATVTVAVLHLAGRPRRLVATGVVAD